MFAASAPRRTTSTTSTCQPGIAPRRGVALVFVLVFVVAMAALAMASIFMSSTSTLLAKSYDRESDLRYAAEAALAIGKARINSDPSLLVLPAGTLYRPLLLNEILRGANGKALDGITVNVYAGVTGSSSGQNGRFASVVAQAIDTHAGGIGSGVIRRLELTQESFAKYAYWSDNESNNGTTIFFNNGDELWGPVWSNDVINIGSGGATFHDQVGTAATISGRPYGKFVKPPLEKQSKILLPSTTTLGLLAGYATLGNAAIVTTDGASGDESRVRDRIEFVAFDIDGRDDSTSTGEGFFRVYTGKAGAESVVRGDWPGASNSLQRCGDWHYMPAARDRNGVKIAGDTGLKFYPVSVHAQTWFQPQIQAGMLERNPSDPSGAASYATAESKADYPTILGHPRARCFLGGDPHLVATDRPVGGLRSLPAVGVYAPADVQKGGEDSTFTPNGVYGSWRPVVSAVLGDTVAKLRPWDAAYLNPLSARFNPTVKGVIYTTGNIGVSGVVNGLVTLYSKGSIVILDDIRYANDPVKSVCHDMLGMITDFDVVIADNALNTPALIGGSSKSPVYASLDDSRDLYLHAVLMTLGTAFRVQNYASGPTNANGCDGVQNGRGCIYLSGGIIQKERGAVGTSTGSGYAKRYTYDHCAVRNPPPYFPTTGRFADNRYLELDPVNFKPDAYFRTITRLGP